MKKLFVLFMLVVVVVFTSCESDDVKPTVFKFSVDGVEKDFSSNVAVDFVQLFEFTDIVAVNGTDSLTVSLVQKTTGVFTRDDEIQLFVNGLKYVSGGKKYTTVYSGTDYTINVKTFEGKASEVEGTFSGTLKNIDYTDILNSVEEIVEITDGEFCATK